MDHTQRKDTVKTRDMEKIIADILKRQEEMYEFIEECLDKIYPEQKNLAKEIFSQNYECRENFGCIMGLQYLDRQISPKENT